MAKTADEWRDELRGIAEGTQNTYHTMSSVFVLLKRLYFPGMTILDAGGGVGHFFREIQKLGDVNYTVLDIDPKKIEIGREVWKDDPRVTLHVHDINNPIEYGTYDVVICYTVLVHMMKHEVAIRNLFSAAKSTLIIRTKFGNATGQTFYNEVSGYEDVYPQGIPYNTVSTPLTTRILCELGGCKFAFIGDQDKGQARIIENLVDCANTTTEWKAVGWHVLYIQKYYDEL